MITKIPCELEKYIKDNIIPLYKNFDAAHQKEHVNVVIDESKRLAEYYDVDKTMVYTIAAYHDLGLVNGRDNHHIDSGKILEGDKILWKWFSEGQIQIMKEAVEDHRASSKSEPRSIYGKIVAEADREIEMMRILRRTIQFGLKHHPKMTQKEHYERFYDHIQKKYAEGGYIKLWLPESSNTKKLTEFRTLITDKAKLRSQFIAIYKEELDSSLHL